jgi:DMSO/TMAO reductase YedYZ molybdopterin-dependent catalytic subunit
MTDERQAGGKYGEGLEGRIPPNQAVTRKFPVMTAGKTPDIDTAAWSFSIKSGPRTLASWNWVEFNALPQTRWRGDIHCVTRWSKFDTDWQGVTIDDLLASAGIEPPSPHTLFHGYEGYSTNLLLSDITDGKAMIATRFDDQPLTREHGGPARLLVPHLYFWKSAKWVKAMQFTQKEESGFWELRGYHQRGDPWAEERFS